MTRTPLLTPSGASKRYGGVAANSGIDLTVEAGSIHAILGENGAGKSTLMKLIYGVEVPDEGTILWKGQPVHLASPADARRLGIGMVFQHFSLFETLTVVQNIALIVPGRQAALARRIRDLGDEFGLHVDPAAMVHSLSVGERQRVEIIRSLLLNPDLLILDEPTSVLPPQSVGKLFVTLRALQAKGMAILFISHKREEIKELCDTATILRLGRVTGRLDPRQHSASDLATLMIGREMRPRCIRRRMACARSGWNWRALTTSTRIRSGSRWRGCRWRCTAARSSASRAFRAMASRNWQR
jgi:simple sugar transport system ATP-binding protein